MKKILPLLSLLMICFLFQVHRINAQDKSVNANTVDNRKVVIRENGRWEFQNKDSDAIKTETEAVTEYGKLVVLNKDGTWSAESKRLKEEIKQEEKVRKEAAKIQKESAPFQIETTYDRFDDSTTIGTGFNIVKFDLNQSLRKEIYFYSFYQFKGRQNHLDGNSRIVIKYTLFGKLSPLADHNLVFLIDGIPLEIGEMEILETKLDNGYITVFIGKQVSSMIFEKLANARIIEGRLSSGIEFKLESKQIFTLRNFAKQVNPTTNVIEQNKTTSPTKTKVSANNTANGWINTGIFVYSGQTLVISATGEISLGNQKFSSPSGINLSDPNKLLKKKPTGGLIAVIGDDNNNFYFIGNSSRFVAQNSGILFLGINEGNLDDNSGEFEATIQLY